MIHYLGRYTHRVAISSHRWLWLEDHPVTFRWRDSRHPNQQRRRTLSVHAFLRRFLLPVLPLGFVRIRYFGWCAHRRRNQWLLLGLQLLAAATPHRTAHTPTAAPPWLWACAICGGPMQVVERLTPLQVRLRPARKSKVQMIRSFST